MAASWPNPLTIMIAENGKILAEERSRDAEPRELPELAGFRVPGDLADLRDQDRLERGADLATVRCRPSGERGPRD